MAFDRGRLIGPVETLRKLVRNTDRKVEPDNVHKLRINARRVEAIFEALSLDARGVDESLLKELRAYRKRAGKVRDMDVMIGHVSLIHLKGEEKCVARLLDFLQARRKKYARKLYSEIRQHRSAVQENLKDASAALVRLVGNNGHAPQPGTADTDVAASTAKLVGELAAPQRLSRSNLHSYRLKTKELQNVLRLAAGLPPDFMDELGNVKDAIGEWHDWQELIFVAQKVLDHGTGCRLIALLKRAAQSKYESALSLTGSLRKKLSVGTSVS